MKNVHMRYIRVTEGKIENLKKEGKMRISTLIFIYTIHFAYLKVYVTAHILTVHIFHQLVLLFKKFNLYAVINVVRYQFNIFKAMLIGRKLWKLTKCPCLNHI